ncbi:MAG: hypothetical protein ABI588_06415 [Arenimonas sp.]
MGWKAFWSEILIVVLGVVIALAANEAMEDWAWNNKVKDAEGRLQGDIAWAFLWAAEKYATQPCVDAQLAALSRTVLESGETLEPVPVQASSVLRYVVRMPNRPYRFPVWDAVLADGSATHFAPQRQALFGRISDSMAQARLSETETHRLMGSLLAMRDPIALDPVVRSDLLAKINELRSMAGFEALNAQQRMRVIADAGSAPTAAIVAAFLDHSGAQTSSADFSGTAQYCKAQGLPLADWHDFASVTAGSSLYPVGTGAPK